MRPSSLSRRALLLGGAASLLACHPAEGEPGVVRLGHLSNLTHGPAITSVRSGSLASRAKLEVQQRVFRAGPRVIEALVGGAIDVGVSGPAPVLATHARHGPGMLVVLAGIASGGASLVLGKGRDPSKLAGASFATTQLGSTQDVSLRRWLASQNARTTDKGGDVRVTMLAPAVILRELARGGLFGAWLPEPWASRAVSEGCARAIDERDLWPDRTFAAALLVARGDFVRARPDDTARVQRAIAEEVSRARAGATKDETYDGIDALTRGAAGKKPVFDEAWRRVDFISDTMRPALERFVADARAVGALPEEASCEGLFA